MKKSVVDYKWLLTPNDMKKNCSLFFLCVEVPSMLEWRFQAYWSSIIRGVNLFVKQRHIRVSDTFINKEKALLNETNNSCLSGAVVRA